MTAAHTSAVLLIAVLSIAASSGPPRQTMHRIFDRFAEMLPLVLDDDHFLEAETQKRIGTLLDELQSTSDALIAHAAGRDADFRFHAEQLATDIAEAQRRQSKGLPEEARFFVVTATQSCIGCHSRLPKARNFPLARKLTDAASIQALDPAERALFQIATRAFATALDELEGHLLDPTTNPRIVSNSDLLDYYLTTAIRVERDTVRAQRFLADLARRSDLNESFLATTEIWSRDLSELATTLEAKPELATARGIVERVSSGEAREALARDLVASSLLHQLLDGGSLASSDRAEAYYLLGVAGDRHATSFWRPETAVHLERAIRLAPDAEHASIALDRLRSHWEFMYGGSQGSSLPRGKRETLVDLEQIIDRRAENVLPADASPAE